MAPERFAPGQITTLIPRRRFAGILCGGVLKGSGGRERAGSQFPSLLSLSSLVSSPPPLSIPLGGSFNGSSTSFGNSGEEGVGMGEDPLSPPRSAGAFAEERREGGRGATTRTIWWWWYSLSSSSLLNSPGREGDGEIGDGWRRGKA